jgi:hypothetical protein
LIQAGLWERADGGFKMLQGPHNDPDLPLPLWRYSDDDLGGRLFAVDDSPNNQRLAVSPRKRSLPQLGARCVSASRC